MRSGWGECGECGSESDECGSESGTRDGEETEISRFLVLN